MPVTFLVEGRLTVVQCLLNCSPLSFNITLLHTKPEILQYKALRAPNKSTNPKLMCAPNKCILKHIIRPCHPYVHPYTVCDLSDKNGLLSN